MECPIEEWLYGFARRSAAVATLLCVHATVVRCRSPSGAGRECENGETKASDRSTGLDGRGLVILHNLLGWEAQRWPPWRVAVRRSLGAGRECENGENKRPTVAPAWTGEAWSYYITCWGEYTTGTKLVGPDVVTTTGMLRRWVEKIPHSRSGQDWRKIRLGAVVTAGNSGTRRWETRQIA